MSDAVQPDGFSSLFTRQLHTISSFLAPPPLQPSSSSSSSPSSPPLPRVTSPSSYEGFKNDLAEIGDSLKTGLSLFSPKKAFSRFASTLLQFDKRVVGISDDVVDFVRDLSLHPESWIHFPFSLQDKDFSMSQVQKDHAFAIQDLVPNLATLRRTIHNFMSDQQFWMIYFILLVPQLNEDDFRLLSTPEILQMHEMLLQKLRKKKNTPKATEDTLDEKDSTASRPQTGSSSETENATNMTRYKNREDDVCFSEVEEEEFKQTQSSRISSASENSDWVRIAGTSKANRSRYHGRRSESEGSSSDWHAVEDLDL